jgi:hypothetical protein
MIDLRVFICCSLQLGLRTTPSKGTSLVLVYKILDPGLILSQALQAHTGREPALQVAGTLFKCTASLSFGLRLTEGCELIGFL